MNRKRSLSKNLSRRPPNPDEIFEAIAEFHTESDRGAAIMAAALVEYGLVHAIRSALEYSDDVGPLFYDEKGPFSSFYSRILAAKALGLLEEDVARDLDIVRDIRNQFAHALLRLSFDNPMIAAECDRFVHKRTDWSFSEERKDVSAARLKYESACYSLTITLIADTNWRLEQRVKERTKLLRRLRAANRKAASLKGGADNVLRNIAPDQPRAED